MKDQYAEDVFDSVLQITDKIQNELKKHESDNAHVIRYIDEFKLEFHSPKKEMIEDVSEIRQERQEEVHTG